MNSIYSVMNASLKTAAIIRDIQISQEVRTFVISIKSHYAATVNPGQGRVLKILLHVSNNANVISPHAGVARSENCCDMEVTGLCYGGHRLDVIQHRRRKPCFAFPCLANGGKYKYKTLTESQTLMQTAFYLLLVYFKTL